jgi:hypothetical protein
MPTYSGLWNTVHGDNYSLQSGRNPLERQIGRILRKGTISLTRLNKVIDTIAAGTSIAGGAAVTYKRITATADPGNPVTQGGVVPIQTVTTISASSSTTAADATKIDQIVGFTAKPSAYPVDKSGNGGGGKLS